METSLPSFPCWLEGNVEQLLSFLQGKAEDALYPWSAEEKASQLVAFLAGKVEDGLFPWSVQLEAARLFKMECAVVERIALEHDLLPARYQRNRQTISASQQLRLFCSKVAVVGCGGLGGYIIEQLARLGVGEIVAIDPDHFVEHNLNRQLLSSLSALGRRKVDVALERVAQINPAVSLIPVAAAFGKDNGRELFDGADVVVDGLDSIPLRLELGAACRELDLPLIHGAIAGWHGQVITQFPGEQLLETVYAGEADRHGIEKVVGNPSFTPAVIASLEVAEVCKVLLGMEEGLRGHVMHIDLLEMEFRNITLHS